MLGSLEATSWHVSVTDLCMEKIRSPPLSGSECSLYEWRGSCENEATVGREAGANRLNPSGLSARQDQLQAEED